MNAASLSLSIAFALAGCASLGPRYQQPALPVATTWSIAASAAESKEDKSAATDIGWRDFFVDERLQQLIALALQNNRDLRVAVLNIEKARAQYRIQRADRLPSINASGTMTRQKAPSTATSGGGYPITEVYSAAVGVSAFELDLFGRVRNLSRAALERYLAQEEARRSAQLSLIAEVANAYLTLAADRELQRLAQETLTSQEKSFRLIDQQHERGAVSGLDLAQAQTTVETARVDAARYAGKVIQDTNALTLLVGATVDDALLPQDFETQVTGLAPLPAGLPSEVLLRRPDVLQTEHQLRSANANIGAARAAFLPTISLTGSIGSASTELSDLFKSGTGTWSFIPQITVPIFQGGRLRGNLGVATADRDIALAQYERTIQVGFREVADALALTSTLSQQRQAQQMLADAAAKSSQLSQARYQNGRDSYLTLLDSQRAEYAARQGLISTRLSEQSNRVTLYKVLGGGWQERAP
jgi:multidrug efflux system outer membrane protein